MIYPYFCEKCDHEFDVIKSMNDASRPELCEQCQGPADRVYTPSILIGTSVESAEWNPGLGMVIKNKRHRQDEARARGLEEVGNENPKKIREQFAKAREEKRRREWEKL